MSKNFANSVALNEDSQLKERKPGLWVVEDDCDDFLTACMEMGVDEEAAKKLLHMRHQLPHNHKEIIAELRRNHAKVKQKMEELEILECSLSRLLTLAQESQGRDVSAALRLMQLNNF